MILPIVAYGNPILKRMCEDIDSDYPNLDELIENMRETMQSANGVGLAAPQIGIGIRLFVVNGAPISEDEEGEDLSEFQKVFINPEIIEEDGDEWEFNEGCLSIPAIREDIERKPYIRINYLDEHFNEQEERFSGLKARIIQHEYDHIEGVLFVDHLSPLKKKMLKGKLTDISKGKVDVDYKMVFPLLKKQPN